jgi:signal transduction histidine kinase
MPAFAQFFKMLTMSRYLLLFMLFGFSSHLFAADKMLDASQMNQMPISLTEYFAVLEDTSNALKLADVQKADVAARFKTNFQRLNLGYSRSSYWLRLTLQNPTDQPLQRMLEIGYPLLSYVQFHQPLVNGEYQSTVTGLAQPFTSRPYDHRYFVFPVTLPAHSEQIYFLRFYSTDAIIVPAQFWQPEAFHRYERNDYFFQSWYFGVATAMILLNFFLFIALRDRIYFSYVVFASCMSISVASASGLSNQFLWSNATNWADIATLVFSSLTMLTWLLFMRQMLMTEKVIPKLDWLLKILIGIYFVTLGGLFISQQSLAHFVVLLYQTSAIIILVTALVCTFKRQRSAYFFLAASTLLCLSIVVFSLKSTGLLPSNFFTLNAIRLSSGLEMLLLAFALADRFNGIRQQKENAQQRLVENLKSSEQILEARVLERTNALEITGEQLKLSIEKERASSTEKSYFLGMLMHELKSPLSTISFALENIKRSNNPQILEMGLAHIHSASQDMTVITQRSLHADKLEQGNPISHITPFLLNTLIYGILKEFQEPDRFQIIVTDSISMTNDEMLCRIVVNNLVENALKYSPPKSIVKLTLTKEQTGVFISVCNEIGKAGKPDATKVFSKYYRSENAQRLRGTGLGLWLVRGIATQLGGTVNYVEHDNKVEFQLWLPQSNPLTIKNDDLKN